MSAAARGAALEVRDVTASDVTEVVSLVRDVLAEFGLRFGEGSPTDAELAGLPSSYAERGGAFWVAVAPEGAVVGTCGVFPVAEATYELRKMYLRPAARGAGAGGLLLAACVAFVRSRGASRLVLDTTHQMGRAIAFYEKNGFVRDDTQIRGTRCSRGYRRDL